jgi:hypothetical protein
VDLVDGVVGVPLRIILSVVRHRPAHSVRCRAPPWAAPPLPGGTSAYAAIVVW